MKRATCRISFSVLVTLAVIITTLSGVLGFSDISGFAHAEDGDNVIIGFGDYNETVITLHQKMSELGYFKLRAESPFGPASSTALRAIQEEYGLEPTGVIKSSQELDAILSADRKDGWVQDENGWKYYEGRAVTNNWKKINDIWYRFDSDGYMLADTWFQNGELMYWLKANGAMASQEWITIDGDNYYFVDNGAMVKGQWIQLDDIYYYLKEDGKMAVEEWIGPYWVDADGHWIEEK